MTPPPSTTVVIPARNAVATLGAQLQALAEQSDGSFEVVVVDDASTDGTAELALRFCAVLPLRVVNSPGAGANHARNLGIRAATTERILLTDADDVVGPQWVHMMSQHLRPGVWVAGRVDVERLNDRRTLVIRDWGDGPQAAQVSGEAIGFLGTIGCNCGFTKSDWAAIGGFDERLSVVGDETEFFARLAASGRHGVFVRDAVVHYRLRPGLVIWIRDRWRCGVAHQRALSLGVGDGFTLDYTAPALLWRVGGHLVLSVVDGWTLKGRARRLGRIAYYLGRLIARIRD